MRATSDALHCAISVKRCTPSALSREHNSGIDKMNALEIIGPMATAVFSSGRRKGVATVGVNCRSTALPSPDSARSNRGTAFPVSPALVPLPRPCSPARLPPRGGLGRANGGVGRRSRRSCQRLLDGWVRPATIGWTPGSWPPGYFRALHRRLPAEVRRRMHPRQQPAKYATVRNRSACQVKAVIDQVSKGVASCQRSRALGAGTA